MKYLFYITKGLKPVVQREITQEFEDLEIQRESDKYLIYSGENLLDDLTDIRSADDVHLLIDVRDFDDRPENSQIIDLVHNSDTKSAFRNIESLRTVEKFSLTASKYRNKKADLDEIEEALRNSLGKLGLGFSASSRQSDIDLRMHLEKNRVLLSVRIPEKPLYFREYWENGRKGSLKTSIASGLVQIGEPEEGEKFVDNFCGAGTVLCEAQIEGLEVRGGDIEREAVECTRTNLSNLNQQACKNVRKLDARNTDFPDDYFDLAVSNFLWGKQVDLDAVNLYSKALQEYKRILKENGRLVILGDKPDLCRKHLKKNFPDYEIEKFQLGFLGQTPTVLYARPEKLSV